MTPTYFLHTKILTSNSRYLFCTQRYIFQIAYQELENNQWFISKKLSLNIKKIKTFLFSQIQSKEHISLLLPKLIINNHEIQRREQKFWEVLLNENVSWKEQGTQ